MPQINDEITPPGENDPPNVPFWIVLTGVRVGAFWALAGVGVRAVVARGRVVAYRPL